MSWRFLSVPCLVLGPGLIACGASSEQEDTDRTAHLSPKQRKVYQQAVSDGADPDLIPDLATVPELSCEIYWNAGCSTLEQDCCYGPCIQDGCIGCLPPGQPCIQHEECCGECSTECSAREGEACGICLLAAKGKRCHDDQGCASGRCVDFWCR